MISSMYNTCCVYDITRRCTTCYKCTGTAEVRRGRIHVKRDMHRICSHVFASAHIIFVCGLTTSALQDWIMVSFPMFTKEGRLCPCFVDMFCGFMKLFQFARIVSSRRLSYPSVCQYHACDEACRTTRMITASASGKHLRLTAPDGRKSSGLGNRIGWHGTTRRSSHGCKAVQQNVW